MVQSIIVTGKRAGAERCGLWNRTGGLGGYVRGNSLHIIIGVSEFQGGLLTWGIEAVWEGYPVHTSFHCLFLLLQLSLKQLELPALTCHGVRGINRVLWFDLILSYQVVVFPVVVSESPHGPAFLF